MFEIGMLLAVAEIVDVVDRVINTMNIFRTDVKLVIFIDRSRPVHLKSMLRIVECKFIFHTGIVHRHIHRILIVGNGVLFLVGCGKKVRESDVLPFFRVDR